MTTALVALALVPLGCNSKDRAVEVSGKVEFNGQPLKSGLIHFEPADGNGASGARSIDDGNYEFGENSQMQPGEYRVSIRAVPSDSDLDADAAMNQGPQPRFIDPIPKKYNDHTELTAKVTAEGPNTFDFDLKSK
ncbi:carboxypeptidase regulatory-like domain-containing protein [Blastopirellula marina]|uniref:Carboxypeptidase regulatory-like domain-containing protein n=1 Tax=Blastopirellula marina TaxID=124 RepID=A0A2S8GLU0_9BACT|nr:carboxypeptidase regulatory-like domain-containing protein [Blastopirellula marina]PQO45402.1 hypothetical protein C5Y93_13195 [Blastopirellula marina]